MTDERFFSISTLPPWSFDEELRAIASGVSWLVENRHPDGTWGSDDQLDKFICTCHASMTLMSVGIPPNSTLVQPSLDFLSSLDRNRMTTFFWRIAPLLRVPGYEDTVAEDIEHLVGLMERSGGNPNYPAPFFLLKVLKYLGPEKYISETRRVVDWVLSEWSKDTCWSDTASITSMALALVADDEATPANITNRSLEFLLSRFKQHEDRHYGFSPNIIDDAFVAYNLFDRADTLRTSLGNEIFDAAEKSISSILGLVTAGSWRSPPPYGGTVDSPDYATAVIVRAAVAIRHNKYEDAVQTISAAITEELLSDSARRRYSMMSLTPFWGPLEVSEEPLCFIAMPYSPARRTEIYEGYIKGPIEANTPLKCRRVDDMTKSSQIMSDMWTLLLSCRVVIADLSEQNPNVFYELGLAHVLGKPVILIVEDFKDVPFDLQHVRTIVYGDSHRSWERLSEVVVEYVKAELASTK